MPYIRCSKLGPGKVPSRRRKKTQGGNEYWQSRGRRHREHIHMHVLPRWVADANFMTVIGETRVLPELLGTTYQRLKSKF